MTKEGLKDSGIALLRVGIGGVFVAHGIQKLAVFGISGLAGFLTQIGVPFPTLSAIAVTAARQSSGIGSSGDSTTSPMTASVTRVRSSSFVRT